MTVVQAYAELMASPGFAPDPAQEALVARLDALAKALSAPPIKGLSRLFGGAPPPPRGLYIHGSVGRGKTLLMDMFFAAADIAPKRRQHAHAFMADVHMRLHAWRRRAKRGEVSGADPVIPVANEIAGQAKLLCFDEFSVRDIADAMILSRLFGQLFAQGVVVVATSNVAPDDLYQDGLNRASFLPFIALVHEKMDVVELTARTDFRLEKLGRAPVYWTPDDSRASAALDAAFRDLSGRAHGAPIEIVRLGRVLTAPDAADGVARFSFDALCRAPLAAGDYLAFAERFHTFVIDHIPVFKADERNEAKRFIALIDALYDRRVKLVASAAAEPGALVGALEGAEAFEFARAASRLFEMRSPAYLASAHGPRARDASGVVET